jgi:hypothetical protein
MSSQKESPPLNPRLEWFVYEFCGGPTKASFALQVSSATIHDWLVVGHVRSREKAIEAAEFCHGKVSAAELMNLPEPRENGPTRGTSTNAARVGAPSVGRGERGRKGAAMAPAASLTAPVAKGRGRGRGRSTPSSSRSDDAAPAVASAPAGRIRQRLVGTERA